MSKKSLSEAVGNTGPRPSAGLLTESQCTSLFLELQDKYSAECLGAVQQSNLGDGPELSIIVNLTPDGTNSSLHSVQMALDISRGSQIGIFASVTLGVCFDGVLQSGEGSPFSYALTTNSRLERLVSWLDEKLLELPVPVRPEFKSTAHRAASMFLRCATDACRAEDPSFGLLDPSF